MGDVEEAAFREMFNQYDTDGKGYIDRGDCTKMLKELGLDEADANQIAEEQLKAYDADGDNRVTYKEFKTAMGKMLKEADDEVAKEEAEQQ